MSLSSLDDIEKTLGQKLRIAYVSPGWPLSANPNGIVSYIKYLKEGIDNSDLGDSYVLAKKLDYTDESDRYVVDISYNTQFSIESRLINRLLQLLSSDLAETYLYKNKKISFKKAIFFAIKEFSIDILEIEESFGISSSLISNTRCPIITRIHGPWFILGRANESIYKLRVKSEGEGIFKSHGVTAPSKDVLNRVREYYNIELPLAKVIPNPVSIFNLSVYWKLQNVRSILLFVGRFDLIKGGDILIKAFRIVAQTNKDIELVFVGPDRGIEEDGSLLNFKAYLDKQVPENSIKVRISFLGHCNSEKIENLRQNSLITIIASRYENFPVSLIEALAIGCPVVAMAVGGIKEIIVDGYNGLLAEPGSHESIAEKVLWLIDRPEKMLSMSNNARIDCAKKYSPEIVARQTIDYYNSVLSIY